MDRLLRQRKAQENAMDMTIRPRRLRGSEVLRKMVRETRVDKSSLIYPMFVMDGENKKEAIPSLPGQFRYSVDRMDEELEALYPGFQVKPVRGNLQTRLRKLDKGEYGALVLAAAGLKRMGLEDRISRYFTVDEMIPAAGQGVLAVQGRRGEDHSYLTGYTDEESAWAVCCERAFVRELNGGCSSPVCAYAEVSDGTVLLRGLYYDEKTGTARKGRLSGPVAQAEALGIRLARALRDNREVEP